MNKNKPTYLLNAFSIQMIDESCNVTFEKIDKTMLPVGLTSAIGHQDTANVLGVELNRVSVKLCKGDIAYIAQLTGGRLPEGSIKLPDGFKFEYWKVTVY